MNGHASINRLYRLVWNSVLGDWVAVAENARGRGKASRRRRLLAGLFAGVATGAALADPPAPTQLPTGGKVLAGSIGMSQTGARLDVTQASQRGVVQWATFDLGAQAQIDFRQPSASAVTLNRVLDSQASQIFGRITANGQVFLTNPNGIYFGPGASADVGGLVATTHRIDTADFMAGKSLFVRDGATGSVVNDGTLTAGLGGYIALLAPEVRNRGVVTAQAGTVALASGEAIELHFDGSRTLAGVVVGKAEIDALVENGGAVRAPGGLIVMSAQAASQLQTSVVRNTGALEATGLVASGGRIVLDGSGLVDQSGSADVSGGNGSKAGSIDVRADRLLNSGVLRADGSAGGAGSITTTVASSLIETTSAKVSATGGGGTISVDAGAGQVYSSASYDASGLAAGEHGGSVTLTGGTLQLMGASVHADGHDGGGSVRIGGDLHGANPAVGNATTTSVGQSVVLSADATATGNGGKVVVWADDTTTFSGSVSARGGATGGDGGQLEVSGKGTLHFAGRGDASAAHGRAGNLLLDPKNIVIDDQVTGQVEYVDPHSTAGGTFGAVVTPLTTVSGAAIDPSGTITGTTAFTGYVVIGNPTDTLAAAAGGAAYLFRRSDQALISTLYGTHTGDKVGSSVTALTNGNFVVGSPDWNNGRGAATWGSGTLGWGAGASVAVSAGNSFVGSLATFTNSQGDAAADHVGGTSQIKPLVSGNYLVADPGWGNNAGAVAFGNGATGSSGTIGAANALVGSTVNTQAPGAYITFKYGDRVGNGITFLPNGNYVVSDYGWNKGVGAVTLGSGTAGVSGTVGAANSLVGSTARSDASGNGSGTDEVGRSLQILTGSEFVVSTSYWNASAGALTWSNGSTLATGQVASSNSLVGASGDLLTSGGVTLLPLANAYLVGSPNWNTGRGAVTWLPFGSDPKANAIASSGVVGGTAGDAIGSKSVTLLGNGDYVAVSPGWSSGKGAVTLVDGTTGKTKLGQASTVTAANSLVGSQGTDNVGQQGIVELTGNGNFVAISPNWSNGATSKVGAVTWSSGGNSPTVGAVSSSNSLVGSTANDRVGGIQYATYAYLGTTPIDNQFGTVTALANGNYAVASPMWNGTRGAVTLGNGATGTTGAVGASNSFVGSSVGDFVGSLSTPTAANGPTPAYFTLGNGIQALANGNFVVASDFWKNGSIAHAGAVTWSSGSTNPTVGAVSSANSLIGSTAEDLVGYGYYASGILPLFSGYDSQGRKLYTGNYAIFSSRWDSGATADAGAVTWGSGSAGTTGTIGNANSIVGGAAQEGAAMVVQPLASGNYLVLDRVRDVGGVTRAGALTLVNGATGRVSDYAANANRNIVSATNSLVGSTTDDMAYADLYTLYTASPSTNAKVLETGNYVLASYYWDNGSLADAGALTWGSGTAGVVGAIGRANSVVGEKAGDYLGSYMTLLPTGDYVVGNPTRDIGNVVNAGAASWVSGATGRLSDYAAQGNRNIVSAANSLVGSHPNDSVGDGVASFYDSLGDASRNGYLVFSTSWNCLAGALTYVADGSVPMIGTVSASNSAVGDPNGRFVGGLGYATPYPALVPNDTALATFGGDGGHVYEVTPTMPTTGGLAIANATQFGQAAGATQMVAPDYVASVLRTGTSLTLQASNDILVRGSIDASGGTAGGTLTLDAGRSIALLGDIVTGNRNLTLIANDTHANGVVDAQRDAGIATISMGANPQGHLGVIDAGSGTVSMLLAAGADKTNPMGGSIGLNSITAANIRIVDHGDGLGSVSDLPTFIDCCGYIFGSRTPGANIVLNTGAMLNATGTGTAVTLAADGQFSNASGQAAAIVTTDPAARWLVYAAAPGTSASYGGLDSGHTAVWNQTYDPNVAVAAAGDRYVFAYQPTVAVGTQNVAKTYGDDLTATLAASVLSLSGAQSGVAGAYQSDTLASAVSGSATVSSAGAAATAGVAGGPYAININLSGLTGNNGYAVALGSNTPRTLTVAPKTLTAALTGVTKTYDGSATATLAAANYSLGGLVNGDAFDVTKTSGSYNAANVTASSASTTLASGDFTGLAGTLASNYTLPTTASGAATISPKALTASLPTLIKVYDGSTAAAIGAGQATLGGFVAGQSATVGALTGAYNSADVATANSVGAALALGNVTAGSGTSLANYVLPTTASGAATITPKALTATLAGSFSKTYDGTTAVALNASNVTLGGVVGGQSVTVNNATGAFNAASVAGASSVTATLGTQDFAAGSGTLLSNYQLPTSASGSGSITPAPLTVTATGGSRAYNGNAFSGGNGVTVSGLVAGETSAVLGGSLVYGGSAQGAVNAGSYGISASGYSAANYTIGYAAGTETITPVQLAAQLVGPLGKVYDATTTASFSSANLQLAGFVGSEGASVGPFSGTYDGANAGTHSVSASLAAGNFSAHNGTLLSNYLLPTSASASTTTITPKALTATLSGSFSKTYDGTTAATLNASNVTLGGVVGGQSVTVNNATGAFNAATVAGASSVTATLGTQDFAAGSGTLLSNYQLPTSASGSGSITRATLTVTATGGSRAYNGNAFSGGNGVTVSGLVNGETSGVLGGSLVYGGSAQGAVNAGSYGISASGYSAANYTIGYAAGTETITPVQLTTQLVGSPTKVYDGSTAMSIHAGQVALGGFVGVESAAVGALSGAYNSADVATADSFTALLGAGNVTAGSGTTLANYVLPTTASGAATITPKTLTATLNGSFSKTYDGTTAVALNASNVTLGGVLGGQSVTVNNATGAFNAATVAGASSVTASLGAQDFSAGSGTLLSNYQLPTSASGSGSISRAPLTVTATGGSRAYNGNALSGGNGVTVSGLVNGETSAVLGGSLVYGGSAQGAVNAGSYGISASGYSAANYAIGYAAGTETITPVQLSAQLVGPLGKVYDATTTASFSSANLQLTGFVGSEGASVGPFAGTYDGANAGTHSVSASLAAGNFSAHNGTLLSNYLLPTSASASTTTITPKALTATLAGSFSKTYDGTTAATLNASNVTLGGVVGGQSVTVNNATGAFNAATVAGATRVIATLAAQDFAAGSGTLLSNYQLPTSASGNGAIAPAALTVTASGGSRAYNGQAFSGGNGVTVSGLVNGETSAVLGGSLVYGGSAQGAVNVGSYTLLPSGYSAANYTIGYAAGTQTITPVQLTAQLVGPLGKVYDATTAASFSSANLQLTGFVGSEGASVGPFGGTYDGANAGTHRVDATLAANNVSANAGTLLTNYVLPTSATGSAAITPRPVTLTAPAISKVYDGSTAYVASAADLAALSAGLLGHDAVAAASLGFADKNAGSGNRVVNLGGVTVADGNGGGNYSITLAAGTTGSIAPRPLTVVATASAKVYDSTTAASVAFADDRIAGDTLTVAGSASFVDKNVGTAKPVTVSGLTLLGSDAGNYSLTAPTASSTASITPATLLLGGVAAVGRAYDAGTAVVLSGTPTVTPLGHDVVTIAGSGTGTLADKNAGLNKPVAVAGYTVSDPNYVLVPPQGLTVDIAPALLTVNGVAAVDRSYDAGTGVALTGRPTVAPLGGDSVVLAGTGTATLADKNAGAHRPVAITGYTINDPNYTLVQPQGVTVDIAPALLAVGGVTAVNRAYDAGTGVALTGTPTVAPLGTDVVVVTGTGAGTLADKNAGLHKAISVGGYTISDPNYTLVEPQGLTVDVAPAVLTLGGLTVASAGKTYDGTRTVLLGGTPVMTGLDGQTVALTGTPTGQTADKNVGSGKPVSVGGLVSTDANYVVGQQPGLRVDVTPATLVVTGISVANKSFDGKVDATLSGTPRVTPDSGDQVVLGGTPQASFASAGVGKGKPVTVVGYELAGADRGNYTLGATTLSADIVAAPTEAPPLPVVPSGLPGLATQPVLAMPAPVGGFLQAAPAALPVAAATVAVASAPVAVAATPVATAAPAIADRVAASSSAGLVVSLLRTPSAQQGGEVAVSVPQKLVQDARGFAFALPATLMATAAAQGTEVRAAAIDGGPLPGWIRYDAQTGSFAVTNPPAGALPLRVSLTIGSQQTTLVVAAQ